MPIAKAKILWLVLFTLLVTTTVRAQNTETKVKMKDLPAVVQQTVKERSQGATIRGLSKEVENGQTFYEVELKVAGHSKDVLIDEQGKVVTVEEQVAMNALSQPVRGEIIKQAGKGKVLLVESVTKGDTLEYYEAHVKQGAKTAELKISPTGQLIK